MFKTPHKIFSYISYKDSNAKWAGKIPSHWSCKALKHIASLQSGDSISPDHFTESGYPVFGGNGFRGYTTTYNREGRLPLIGRQGALCGNVNYSEDKFYASEHAIVATPKEPAEITWLGEAIRSADFNRLSQSTAQPGISVAVIENVHFPLPPLDEQISISRFVERNSRKIKSAIKVKEKQIALLKERKQILIQNAVTRGLDPDVPMQDSCIEWIGEIPKHWNIRRAKYLFQEIDERSASGQEELLSVSHTTGVTPRSKKNVSMFMAADYTGANICQPDDLIFNIMWAWMGALGVADRPGIVSSSYGVFRQRIGNTFNPKFLESLLKTTPYIEHYNRVSTGLHSSRLRLYPHMFLSMKIGFPSREEQDKIMAHIDLESAKIDRAIKLLQSQIERLKEYRATLINSAVTGKIRVPGVEDPARQEAMA